ncbi:MAG: DUF4157 domain-containing protein, partial [Bacteroidota bacterium]
MKTYAENTQNNNTQAVSTIDSQAQNSAEAAFSVVGHSPVMQRQLKKVAYHSPQASPMHTFQDMADKSPQVKRATQLQAMANNHAAQQPNPVQKKENKTGLPDHLKTGMERLSGLSLDDVKVHRNSAKPKQLNAYAYAQGTDIHLAPGQEKHLPHEAWHVVQQKQGRVKPTLQMKGKVYVNDDAFLEKE